MGGIRTNEQCETNLPGLYAAGECSGLVNGANRLSGVALGQILVQGERAGTAAADYSQKVPLTPPNQQVVKDLKARISVPIENRTGLSPVEFRKRLQNLAYQKVGVIRNLEKLECALEEIEVLKKDLPFLAVSSNDKAYNLEWIEAIQVMNLVSLLEIIARSAIARTESRGAHYRTDYPFTNNDKWLRNVVISYACGKTTIKNEPVFMTSLTPPSGVRSYIEELTSKRKGADELKGSEQYEKRDN